MEAWESTIGRLTMDAAEAKKLTGKKTVSFDKDPEYASAGLRVFGWRDGDGEEIPEQYKVRIVSSGRNCVIIGVLQEAFDFSADSEWAPLVPIRNEGVSGKLNELMQLATHKTLVTRHTSRRIWQGTTPTSITLNLVFESVSDSLINVLRPVKEMLAMISPGLGNNLWTINMGRLGKVTVPLLEPPGPTPFSVPELGRMKAGRFLSNALKGVSEGDHISIKIGDHFEFNNVILKKVTPKIAARFDIQGYPIMAEVMVTFETYEIMTKEAWDDAIF